MKLAAIPLAACCLIARPAAAPPRAATIALCPGLTIVTAVNQTDGDYESIKTVESISDAGVRLKYSVERLVDDMFSIEPPKLVKFTLYRTVRLVDLQSAFLYEQQFSTELPETVPETTAIGTSAAVLNALKTKGEAKIGIFIAYSQIKPSIDRNTHPNVYDNQMVATVTRTGSAPVMVPLIVDDTPVEVPAIQASGEFFGDKVEFFFLDDPANPLTLKYRFGIDGRPALSPEQAKIMGIPPRPTATDKDVLQVVKIRSGCAGPAPQPSPGSGGGTPTGVGSDAGAMMADGGGGSLERELAESGRADVYSIYFSFNSDTIREESEPTLKDIADVLRRHPDWKLGVTGHTDNIGGDQYNLDLSRRRSAAVKNALVTRYGIAAARLTTSGAGKAQPKDTNETLEGRARNRRVELIRS
jgi:outer membrane protein OmpA-like peptidoglycan-associated protein